MPWIVAWVGEDPDGRAGRLARHLPPVFPAVRDFVARFGGRGDVRDGLAAGLASGAYRGSAVSHYADKKRLVQGLSEGESDPNVLLFLAHCAGYIEERMEREAAAGERIAAGLA